MDGDERARRVAHYTVLVREAAVERAREAVVEAARAYRIARVRLRCMPGEYPLAAREALWAALDALEALDGGEGE